MEMSKKTRDVTTVGLGIALFVVLSMALRVPVFENYYLCLGYIAMAVYLYSFGVMRGTIVGTVGTILYCILSSRLREMPGWAIGNILIGINLGVCFEITKAFMQTNKKILGFVLEVLAIIMSVTLGILLVKSLVDVILYSQPMLVCTAKNMAAFIADIIVLIAALPICKIVDAIVSKEN